MIRQITSHSELLENLKANKSGYVLIYKEGSETSECAYKNFMLLNNGDNTFLAVVNVAKVRDVHPNYNITSAPTLIQFENGKMVKTIKGCQTKQYYESMIKNNFSTITDTAEETKRQKPVVVYSTPSCPWCNRLKKYLRENNIKFRDIDVSKDTKAAEEMLRKSGQQGVPQADIAGQIVVGFDKKKIDKLLNIKSH